MMTKEEIRIEIQKCEAQIEKLRVYLRNMEKAARELDGAYSKITSKYDAFCQENFEKLDRISKILANEGAIPMAKAVYNNMRSIYLGADFQRAEQGFVQAKEQIKAKRIRVYDEIDETEIRVQRLNDRLANLKLQLENELSKEGV